LINNHPENNRTPESGRNSTDLFIIYLGKFRYLHISWRL
jgi:hypothetical protein